MFNVENILKEIIELLTSIVVILKLFHDGGCYHIETSPLICGATASLMKELIKSLFNFHAVFSISDRKRYVQKQPLEVFCNKRCS